MATASAKMDRRQTKKDLKQDKLVGAAYKAEQFYHANKNLVIGIAAVIVVSALAILVVRQVSESSMKTETYDLSLGKMAYGSGNLPTAKSSFESVISKYSGWSVAEAHYYLGRIAVEEQDLTSAEEHFKQCLNISGDDNIIVAAKSGLAASLEDRKDYSGAAKLYEEIASEYPKVAFAPEALTQASRLYLKLNQKDDQKRVLKQIVDKYPDSANFAKAKRDLDQLP